MAIFDIHDANMMTIKKVDVSFILLSRPVAAIRLSAALNFLISCLILLPFNLKLLAVIHIFTGPGGHAA
jgi:hypothetical protein